MSSAFANSLERLKYAFSSPNGQNTSRNEGEDALKCLAFDLSPDCISLHDACGEVVLVSPRSREIFGVASDKLQGDSFSNYIHVQDRVAVLKALSDCANDKVVAVAEFRVIKKDTTEVTVSNERWCEIICQPFYIGEDSEALTPVKVIAVSRDISTRKREEARIKRERESAESASIAKGRFLATISHELRTPLNAILGFSEMLKTDIAKAFTEEKRCEYAGHIHESASHLLSVLNDILDMSKIDAGKYEILPEPFDPAEVMTNTVSILQGQAMARGVDLKLQLDRELPEICADKRAVKQILLNLVSNAIKFTDTGGRVRVGAERVGRRLELEISDNGIGISPEHMQHLGEPFYQADSKYDRKYEGTGLGISVVRGLVDLHGGTMTFKSEKGKGTVVTVNLPLVAPKSGAIPASEGSSIVKIDSKTSTDLKNQPNVLNTIEATGNVADNTKERKVTG